MCPRMMAIGMTREEYWHGDVRMTRAFLEAEAIRQKEKLREMNRQAWLSGMYIYDALIRVAPLYQPFSKSHSIPDYPNEPYDLFAEEKKAEEERRRAEEAHAENERLKAALFFKNWAKATAENMKKK